MVLQIVLPEPTNDVNHHRGSGGGGGVGVGNKHNSTNISHHHNNTQNNPHINSPQNQCTDRECPEPWLRRAGSVNSLTESRIGEDSLFSYGYGKQLCSVKFSWQVFPETCNVSGVMRKSQSDFGNGRLTT